MTPDDVFERDLARYLDARAGAARADYLTETLVLTARAKQRPWWSSLERWLPVDLTATRFAATRLPVYRLALAAILIILTVFALALYAGSNRRAPAPPFGPAANGPIVYVANGDIRIADPDGSHARVLIGGPEDEAAVQVSRDGTRLAFVRDLSDTESELLVSDIDGRSIRPLTSRPIEGLQAVDWSPDGGSLVIAREHDGLVTVSIIAADGPLSMRDLDLGILVPDTPVWAPPDGHEILFRGTADGKAGLYAIGADGNGLRELAPALPDADNAYLGFQVDQQGRRVAFWHNLAADNPEGLRSEVHVRDLATGHERRIGYDADARHELYPMFSPDGESVLLVRFNSIPDKASLVIGAADGSVEARRMGEFLDWWGDEALAFSPDGTKVLLSFGAVHETLIIDRDTEHVDTGERADYPSWARLAP